MKKSPNYLSYLLRLWRETPDSPLRASLQASSSNERHHFTNLESLLAFLADQGQAGQAEPHQKGQLR